MAEAYINIKCIEQGLEHLESAKNLNKSNGDTAEFY